jgi:enoyl-[acyl-carrier-protein] reductase (NADH)
MAEENEPAYQGALRGKRAVITGSSLGIGRAVALRFAGEGASVVINARNSEALEETLELATCSGAAALACAGDVASLYTALASDHARGVSGQVFWGSGGYIGRFPQNGQEIITTMDHRREPPWPVEDLATALGFE